MSSAFQHPTSDLLSAIASGQQSLTSIAAAHHIPFPQFTLWLLEPETQEQLAALSAAVASATRLAATSALPEVVNSLKRTLAETSAPEPPQRKTLFPIEASDHDGPNRGQVFRLRRQRVALSASWLLLRLARFTPVNTTSLPRPPKGTPASEILPPAKQGEVAAKPPEGAPVFSTRSSSHPLSSPSPSDVRHPTSDMHAAAPASPSPPTSPRLITPSPHHPLTPSAPPPPEPADFEDAIRCIQHACDLSDEQVAALRADPESWIREHLPEFLDEPALASAHAAGDG